MIIMNAEKSLKENRIAVISPPPAPIALPRAIADVNEAWLTQALSASYSELRVTSAAITRVTQGSESHVSLKVDYNDVGRDSGLPSRLFLKTSLDNVHHNINLEIGAFESEVCFYRDICPELTVPTARVFYADHDATDGQFAILMEDIAAAGAHWGLATEPVSPNTAEVVLRHMADYHAHLWDSTRLDQFGWLQSPVRGALADFFRRIYSREYIQKILNAHRGELVVAPIRDASLLHRSFWLLQEHNNAPPRCLLHGDPHLGNLAFLAENEPVFTDWAIFRKGCWAIDVGYFLVSALSVEDRRATERDLLDSYIARLASHGIDVPPFHHLWRSYCAQPIYGLIMYLATPYTMQPERVQRAYLERFVAAVVDLETITVLTSD